MCDIIISMDIEMSEVGRAFKALGDPTRLRIYDYLRSCCCPVGLNDEGGVSPATGPTAGEVCCTVTGSEVVTSTISHHLKELREASLITVDRRGKFMVCGVDRAMQAKLASYFESQAGETSSYDTDCCQKEKTR